MRLRKDKGKVIWNCPKCGKQNTYDVINTGLGLEVQGDPKCACGLKRFSDAFYEAVKEKKRKKI